jgi:hypothetical protein
MPGFRINELRRRSYGGGDNLIAVFWILSEFSPLSNPHDVERDRMSAQTRMETTEKIPLEISTELRRLAHDLSNSLETIMQASYLLSQSQLDETSQRWAGLIDTATRDAARINREIRDILRSRSS